MPLAIIIFLILTFAGPIWLILSQQINFTTNWQHANRDSAHLAPDPQTTTEAVIQVYAARTFSWRGIFAVHTWVAVKPKDAQQYTTYQVIGWRLYAGYSPLVIAHDIPDRYWFNQQPHIILEIRGKAAENIIPKIDTAARAYPYPNEYWHWPGPNSNTFIAFIARQIPEMKLALPSNAIGKDYLPIKSFFAPTPSGSGYQISIYGILGIMLAQEEGLEINFLGLVYGLSPKKALLKLPGFGDIKLRI